ncbi:ATP-binding protein [Streptomyces sp. So13.3]|nr:ATP-binding protein [Streptomyces sp. So13.3]
MKRHANISRSRPCSAPEPKPEQPHPAALTSGHLRMDLPFTPLVADVARSAVTVDLLSAGPDKPGDDARLAVSEMATNAFMSGSPPLVLCLDWTAEHSHILDFEITVTDGGCDSRNDAPDTGWPADGAESGRGLGIVQAMASAWSLDIGMHATRAWCQLAILPEDPLGHRSH